MARSDKKAYIDSSGTTRENRPGLKRDCLKLMERDFKVGEAQ